jgi:hypothetical protein
MAHDDWRQRPEEWRPSYEQGRYPQGQGGYAGGGYSQGPSGPSSFGEQGPYGHGGYSGGGSQSSFGPSYGEQGRYGQGGYGQGSFGQGGGFGYREELPGSFVGRGPKGYRRSDERIKEDVSDRLEQHPQIDASEIEVQVREAVVTLTGSVDDRRIRRMVEDTVEAVPGVKDCVNQLRVQGRQEQGGSPQGFQASTSRSSGERSGQDAPSKSRNR